jgi:cytochrome c biogenesis protein CcmG/thiol:disulfide interchange protein DsbE
VAEGASRRPLLTVLALGIVIIAVSTLFLLLVPMGESEPGPSSTTVGGHPLLDEPAPEIDLLTLDGERFTLSALRGRPVLINFWATWCPPCRDEFPLLADAYNEHAADGLEIVGVLSKDLVDGGRAFAEDMGATWPMVDDPDQVAWDDYLIAALPTSYFVDPDGIVRAFSLGGFTQHGLDTLLARILPEAEPS